MYIIATVLLSCIPYVAFYMYMHVQSNMKIRCKKHQASIRSVTAKLETARKRLAAEKNVSYTSTTVLTMPAVIYRTTGPDTEYGMAPTRNLRVCTFIHCNPK